MASSLFWPCASKAVREHRLPLDPLGASAALRLVATSLERPLTMIDESNRVPAIFGRERVGERAGQGIGGDVGAEAFERRMITGATEPVFGILKVPFPAVHHSVPEAAVGTLERLADLVR